MKKIRSRSCTITRWYPFEPHIDDLRKEIMDELNHYVPAKSVIDIVEESHSSPSYCGSIDYTMTIKVYYRG